MKTALICCTALIVAPVNAVQVEANHLILSPDEMTRCVDGGGCTLVTMEAIGKALELAFSRGQYSCKQRT